jgi:hypothetical protein
MSIYKFLKLIKDAYTEIDDYQQIKQLLGRSFDANTDLTKLMNAVINAKRLQDVYNSSDGKSLSGWVTGLITPPTTVYAVKQIDETRGITPSLHTYTIGTQRQPVNIDIDELTFFEDQQWALEFRYRSLLAATKKGIKGLREYLPQAEHALLMHERKKAEKLKKSAPVDIIYGNIVEAPPRNYTNVTVRNIGAYTYTRPAPIFGTIDPTMEWVVEPHVPEPNPPEPEPHEPF